MTRESYRVALGSQHYRIERPWGDLPVDGPGRISDVACDPELPPEDMISGMNCVITC